MKISELLYALASLISAVLYNYKIKTIQGIIMIAIHFRFSKVLEMIAGYYCTAIFCPLKIVVIDVLRAFGTTHKFFGLCSALPTCLLDNVYIYWEVSFSRRNFFA